MLKLRSSRCSILVLDRSHHSRGVNDPVSLYDGLISDVGLTCALTEASGGASGRIAMTLFNDGEHQVAVSPAGTAWNDGSAVFRIENDDFRAEYIGLWKYAPEKDEEDYVQVPPGESASVEYDLYANYTTDSDGRYRIGLSNSAIRVVVDDEPLLLKHDCNLLDYDWREPTVKQINEALTYSARCSPTQIGNFEIVKNTTYSMLYGMETGVNSSNPIRQRWFGNTDTRGARIQKVKTAVLDMKEAWDDWTINCKASCSDANTIAYVSSSTPNTIFVCPPFWSYPIFKAMDYSQAGTFLHEVSHLEANTGDGPDGETWGPALAQALAQSSPDWAVKTAANYEYFGSHFYFSRLFQALP